MVPQTVGRIGPDAANLSRHQINQRLSDNLSSFWRDHGVNFALSWMSKKEAVQKEMLKTASPDLKDERLPSGVTGSATDILIPELTQSYLVAQKGRALISLFQKRVAESSDMPSKRDLSISSSLKKAGQMPVFSGLEINGVPNTDAFEGKFAFVTGGRICVRSDDATEKEIRTQSVLMEDGSVTDANVWITANMRAFVILSFLCALADQYLFHCRVVEASRPALRKCSSCGKAGNGSVPLKVCTACQTAAYCDRECQRRDWAAGHKAACRTAKLTRVQGVVENLNPGTPSNVVQACLVNEMAVAATATGSTNDDNSKKEAGAGGEGETGAGGGAGEGSSQ